MHRGCCRAADAAVDAPGYEQAPEEHAGAEEGEDGSDCDEEGAFWEGGFLHERGIGCEGDDKRRNACTSNRGQAC